MPLFTRKAIMLLLFVDEVKLELASSQGSMIPLGIIFLSKYPKMATALNYCTILDMNDSLLWRVSLRLSSQSHHLAIPRAQWIPWGN